jgi:GxxExxY protein
LEAAYEARMAHERNTLGLKVRQQTPTALVQESVKLDCGFRADLVVGNRVVVELKCKEALHRIDEVQRLSHLRLLDMHLGLLINFHVVVLKRGIRTMANNYHEDADLWALQPYPAESS